MRSAGVVEAPWSALMQPSGTQAVLPTDVRQSRPFESSGQAKFLPQFNYVHGCANRRAFSHFPAALPSPDDDEAEYAWLPFQNLKPFRAEEANTRSGDAVLQASVAAAAAMLHSAQVRQRCQGQAQSKG